MTIRELFPLAPLSSLHVGGSARYFAAVRTLEELKVALDFAADQGLPFHLLGGGTNTLFSDEGYAGLMLHIGNRDITVAGTELTADAGAITRLAVNRSVREGLRGLEHIAGIPGTIGGAVRGNAGSFGSETKDLLSRVEVVHRTSRGWETEVLPTSALSFAYRDSTFKRDADYVVWRATFALMNGSAAAGEKLVSKDLAARRRTQPYEFPSVGSVFKNPSREVGAGFSIEQAGCKGLSVGGAEVSEKHANFIVNRGRATATDVLTLIAEVKRRVFEKTGVTLEEEIVVVK